MQRGQSAELTKAKHKSPQEFRHEKTLATQKDLKNEMTQLREQLKERGADRSEYAELEQLNRELKEQIKAKDFTVDQLQETLSLSDKYRSLPIRERFEMRSEIRDILGENEELKSLKEELKALKEAQEAERAELKDQGAIRADYAQMEAKYKAMEIEFKALQNGSAPKTAIEVSKGIERQIEELGVSAVRIDDADNYEEALSKNRSYFENMRDKATPQYFENMIDQHSTTVMGVGKIDKKALATRLATEKREDFKAVANVYNIANELINYKDKAKEVLKSVVESSKKHLESIFSKITGKSLPEVKKERTELLNAQKEKGRLEQQKEQQRERTLAERERNQSKSKGMER